MDDFNTNNDDLYIIYKYKKLIKLKKIYFI